MRDQEQMSAVAVMMKIQIDEPLRDRWLPVIARYFQMMLASSASDARSLTVSLLAESEARTGFVCELRGRHLDGREIRIRSTHADAEAAISHAFARTRREIVRRHLGAGRHAQGAGAH